MISREESRQYLKYTLSVAKIKLLYEKITLTRFTSLYFFSALIACIVLSALQVVSLVHDSEGVDNISSVIAEYDRVNGIAVLKGDIVQLCSGLPSQSGTLCSDIISLQESQKELSVRDDLFESDSDSDGSDFGEESDDDSNFSDDDSDSDSDDEDDILENETPPPASTAVVTSSTLVTEVFTTSSTSSIVSTEDNTSTITSTLPAETVAPTATSVATPSATSPTLTVVTITSSSIATSSSVFSAIVLPEVPSTTSFIFSSTTTLLPQSSVSSTTIRSSTFTTTTTTTTSDSFRATRTESPSPSPSNVPDTSSAQQPSVTVISPAPTGIASPVSSNDGSVELSGNCIVSLTWLNEVIRDTQREDVVIFVFQMWLFGLSLVTVLNESIPHLGAGFFGHALGTAWAAYRVYSTHGLMDQYRNHIVPKACNGRDIMGDWWENRIDDGIALLSLQAAALALMCYLSFKLFNVYASQTYKRAGASSKVHTIYKLVLLFSVCLQLSGFISVASSALWIDKVSHGYLSGLAKHAKFYLAAFIVTLMIQLPWVVLGWISVRRESRIKFSIFCLMSAFSFAISVAMFYSDIYRFLVSTWPFFATMTITSFILIVVTTVLGVLCRVKFGGGLAEHLTHKDDYENEKFDPIYVSPKEYLRDIEKFGPRYRSNDIPTVPLPVDGTHYVEFPVPVHAAGPEMTAKSSVPTSMGSADAPIVPVTRMSVFSKALKEFSVRAPSPSVKSMRPEPLTPLVPDVPFNMARVPLTPALDTASARGSDRATEDANTPRMLIPPSPLDTASAYSFVTPRQTLASQEMPVHIRKGGASSYHRQSSASAYSASSRKYGLPANPRQSTASSFSIRSGVSSANNRASVASKFSFTTRSVAGFPDNARASMASDTFSVNSRLVGLPANPRARMVTDSESYNV